MSLSQRYFTVIDSKTDPKGQKELRRLKCYIGGEWRESETKDFRDGFNPSTGQVIAKVPACTGKELSDAIMAARKAFPAWSNTSVYKRVQVLFKMKELVDKHLDELTLILATEEGKNWAEAKGDVLKALEAIEFACGMPDLLTGRSLFNISTGYDCVEYREPVGVFLGLVPWNFPAMIPQGWMTSMAIAAGNTFVLKAASNAPQTSMRFTELWEEAGVPPGVLNVITANPADVHKMIEHPELTGVSFVGSSVVGRQIYAQAAQAGKRVQILGQAKNHALVMADCNKDRTAAGIINATFGCAGERCMALPVIVVQESIADEMVALLKEKAMAMKIGPAYDQETNLGPVVTGQHRKNVVKWIEKGVEEGATLVLDGRNHTVPGYEDGFYIAPTIFDHVKPGMSIGDEEIFGPVLCVKRVKDFEEGLAIMNGNPLANGSIIYTSSGRYGREFAKRTDGGMVGINVGIPAPVGTFSFSGHKGSFFGDLHTMGLDGVRFYTELKVVTSTWFTEDEKGTVSTWDGTMAREEK